ncbi:hypothetical protein WHR41_08126 [Cladosporium halotolerans]|uniref:Uncharacterized protein n=1 Tax=Cladosporium halotolerans TaxID=1052096 RepID=A0AB34KKE6_9PEZI
MTTLTTRETALLAGAIASCTKSPVEIDYAKFAARFGFKNSNSSKASWHAIKKKLDRVAAEGDADAAEEDQAGKKRKGSEEDVDGEVDEQGAEDIEPVKKKGKKGAKKGKGGAKAKVESEEEINDAGDGEGAEKIWSVSKMTGGKAPKKMKVESEDVDE